DLATTDAAAAKKFYTEILGWTYNDMPMGEGQFYSMCLVNGKEACALHGQTMGQPPHWGAYVTVDSADATAAKAKELGGSVLMEIKPEWGPDVPPHWLLYFMVDNVDDAVGKTKDLGGKVYLPPMDIPGVGRFSVVADPQGAVLAYFK